MHKNTFFYKNYKFFITFYFTIVFITGFLIIDDYGVTLDDYIYYTNGENTYLYIKQVFLSFFNNEIEVTEYKKSLNVFPVVYELFLVLICKLFNVTDIDKIYLVSHRLNFLIFFISLVVFFFIIQKRFSNIFLSLLAVTFIVLSPRLYAESFYNSRDIFFMCVFIFFLYAVFNFLSDTSFKNLLYISFFSALIINTKILGIIPFFIFISLYLYNFLNTKNKFFKEKNIVFLYLFFCFFFIYILWPFLWDNPINNFYFALKHNLKVHEDLVIINYYFGKYISSDLTPWHYRLVWLFITTPIMILILFIFGLIALVKKLFSLINKSINNYFEFNTYQLIDFLVVLTFVMSFFIVIEFNRSKFGGWRHLYYLYPLLVYIVIYYINIIKKKPNQFYKKIILILILVNLFYNLYWSIKNHPHQYVFFNFISKSYAVKNFDLDWWGISHKSSIEYILKENQNNDIKIYAEGFTSLYDTYLYLSKNNKKRIILSNFENTDYIIDNNMKRIRGNINVSKDDRFKLVYQIIVNNQAISSIYKKK